MILYVCRWKYLFISEFRCYDKHHRDGKQERDCRTIYDLFCGQPKLAIKHLLKMQNGERPKVLHRIFVIEITYVIFKKLSHKQ